MMTLEETLAYCKENDMKKVAEWLEELKDYRDKNKMVVRIDFINAEEFKDMAVKLAKQQYDNAIDDFLNAIKTTDELIMSNCSIAVIESIAEQLKEGGTD